MHLRGDVMRVNVRIGNVNTVVNDIQRFTDQKVNGIKRVVVESAASILNQAISLAPVNEGNLKNSGDLRIKENGLKADVFFTANYAQHVEFGTRPHKIKAKPGGVLHFKVNGRDVFAKEVNHPGTKAQPFLVPAHEAERPVFIRNLREELRR